MIKNHTNEQMDEINEDEVFEKKESKLKPKLKEIFKNKKIIAIVVAIIIIAVFAILEVTTGIFSDLIYFNSGVGNSVGNITNCGYAVEKDDYIYYVAPSESMESTDLHKVKKGTTDVQTIFNGNYDIRALNIVGNHIYFIALSTEEVSEDDNVDNKIYKMKLDGSDLKVLNDNEFSYDYYDMYVVKNRIYYVGEDYNVYKMDLNGGKRELVAETGTGYLAINEKYIIYNKANEEDTDFITYISKLDGTDERAINNSRINTPDIFENEIYYLNDNQNIVKISINGGEEQVIYNGSAYNMNIHDGYIYYLNYKDEANEDYTVCIYRISCKGGEPELIKELSYYASFLDIVDGYIYYMDMDEEKAFINLINTVDSTENSLYEWKYEEEVETEE